MGYVLLISFVYATLDPSGVNNIVTTPVLNTKNSTYTYDECENIQNQFIEYSKVKMATTGKASKIIKISAECVQPDIVNVWYDDAISGVPLERNGDVYSPIKYKLSSPSNNKYNLK